jgi:Leucine-rich repeat (LRR) protein
LYLGNQKIDEEFTFDEYSLAAISSTLKYLDLQKSNVKTSRQLYYLENLEIVDLKFNLIEDFTD